MTRSTPSNRADFVGTGTTGPFPFTFPVSDASHLVVIQTDLAGNETTPSYTVTGIGTASGGSITLTTALTTGYALMIKRVVPLTQPTSIRNQGAFYPEIHEDVFDRLTDIDQQQQEEIDRAIALPENMSPVGLPAPVNGTVLGWLNGAWTWVAAATTGLQALLAASGGAALLGWLSAMAGAIATTQDEVNSRTIHIQNYLSLAKRLLIASRVGADISTELTAAMASLGSYGGTILFPRGVYLHSTSIQ